MSYSEHEQIEEQIHFSNIVATFERYEQHSISANVRRRKDFLRLPVEDQTLLDEIGWKSKLDDIDTAIQANARFLRKIVMNPEIFEGGEHAEDDRGDIDAKSEQTELQSHDMPSHGSPSDTAHDHSHSHSHSFMGSRHSHDHSPSHNIPSRMRYRPSESDMDKLRSTIKQLVRDWGEEGRAEREACYTPMINRLLEHFSQVPVEERRNVRVLVPGAGLARLALDVAKLGDEGFACQGNEFSHHMLLTSYFILNRTECTHEHTIYPYIHSFSNTRSAAALLRSVTIPDVLPSDLPEGSDFSLVAGDFEEIYGAEENDARGHETQVGKWDAILTCFFIDTAKNIVNYLRILHRILAPGGIWINLGPLLWHFENNATNDISIEVDLQEVKTLARKIGFEISEERVIETTYTSDSSSMLGYVYKAEFWVARKVSS
ncbi:N2227-domain-containing protein [Gautieria morchelliformis]|nr:N2227-domain-containing protein [Gautieria morchelliformis]